MNILYLHQYFNTPAMPGGIRSFQQARRLVQDGHKVYVITSWRNPTNATKPFRTIEHGIHVLWIPIPYSNHMGFYQRLIAFFRFAFSASLHASRTQADVIFATSTPLTICIPAIYAKIARRIPMVFEIRDLWPAVPIALGAIKNPLVIGMAQWLERFAYRHSSRIVALAPGMRNAVIQLGYPRQRIAVIPNGADIELFQEKQSVNLEIPYPWIQCSHLIVYAGTIGQANGVSYIPRLAAAITQISPNNTIRFAILGDGRLLNSVKNEAAALDVLDRSVFFVGNISKTAVPAWIQRSAATIMTYDGPSILYRDSVSNKFFDSMAAGKPVLANFCGFSTMIAAENNAGMILPRHDMHLAAQQLIAWLNNSEAMLQRSSNAFALASQLFDRKKLTDDFAHVVLEAATNRFHFDSGRVGVQFTEIWNRCLATNGIHQTNNP